MGGATTEVQVGYYFSWATRDRDNTKGKEKSREWHLSQVLFGYEVSRRCGAGGGAQEGVLKSQWRKNLQRRESTKKQTDGRVNRQKGAAKEGQNQPPEGLPC